MIVKFAVDPAALALSTLPPPMRRALHRALLERWRHLGILFYAGATIEDCDLLRAIRDLPQDLRKLWQEAIRRHRIRRGPTTWQGLGVAELSSQLDLIQDTLDLACVDAAKAAAMGLNRDEGAMPWRGSRLELTRFDCAADARAFHHAAERAQSPIREGTPVDEVWEARFARLAEASRQVSIVDRYCVDGLLKSRDGLSGLAFLLGRLGRSGNRCNVSVYARAPEDYTYEGVRRVFRERFLGLLREGVGIEKLTVFLTRDRNFAKISHGRFLRFDGHICEIDTGLDVLMGKRVWRLSSFSLKLACDSTLGQERELRRSSEWSVAM